MSAREKLVSVCTTRYMEAQIIKGRLESEGIPVLLSYESAGLVYGLTIDGLGEVKIMVPKRLAEEAKEILGISVEKKKQKYLANGAKMTNTRHKIRNPKIGRNSEVSSQ
jgi:hypothetical protein